MTEIFGNVKTLKLVTPYKLSQLLFNEMFCFQCICASNGCSWKREECGTFFGLLFEKQFGNGLHFLLGPICPNV